MGEEVCVFLRMAHEPTFIYRGDSAVRTDEHWVCLYVQNGKYVVEFGDYASTIDKWEFSDRTDADIKFNGLVELYGMKEDKFKTVWKENEKLSLEQIIRAYFEEGDYLEPDMDSVLEQIKDDVKISYSYKNLYSDANGFLAHVKIRKQGYKDKVEVFIEGDGFGHLVKKIQTI